MIPQLVGRSREERRQAILAMERENAKQPVRLAPITLPAAVPGMTAPFAAWRSREFLVQAFAEAGGIVRLSVNRTHVDPATMRWLDGIVWDELQALKSEAGYGDREAVEIYPPDSSVVNVGSLRHLWVLPERMPFSWGR